MLKKIQSLIHTATSTEIWTRSAGNSLFNFSCLFLAHATTFSSTQILCAYLAEDAGDSTVIVYSADSPSLAEPNPIIVLGNRIVLMPSRKAMVYRIKVAKCSNVLALRIPKPFARILSINPKDNVNIICCDDKIIVKPVASL